MTEASTTTQILVAEIDAWTGSAVQTLRFSSHSFTTRPNENPANTFYDGKVKDFGAIARLLFAQGGTSGAPTVNVGFIELSNVGSLDPLFNYGFDGRAIRILSVPSREAGISAAEPLFAGTLAGIDTTDATRTIRLRLRDMLAHLDQPLLTLRYAGTTLSTGPTAEGDATLQGQIKPYAWGFNQEVPGKLVNAFDLIYQFANNPQDAITVFDGGLALSQGGDAATLASLQASIVPAGFYATCFALGLAKLGAPPARKVTATLSEGQTFAFGNSAARVTQRMLAQFGQLAPGEIDTASFDAAAVSAPQPVGIYVPDDQTALAAVSAVLDSVGLVIAPTMAGTLECLAIREPSPTVVTTLTMRDLLAAGLNFTLFSGPSQDSQGIPAWSVVLNYAKAWDTQTESESLDSVDPARRQFIANTWRTVSAQDPTVLTAHPHAVELTFDTLLAGAPEAQAEAARRLGLYGVRRDRLEFTTFSDRGDVELGRSVAVQIPRFGYNAGKNFLVIGRSDDFTKRRIRLTLWG